MSVPRMSPRGGAGEGDERPAPFSGEERRARAKLAKDVAERKVAAQELVKIGHLSAARVEELRAEAGPTGVKCVSEPAVVLKFVHEHEVPEDVPPVLAYRNQCQHMGGQFANDIEDVVRCKNHGWKFDTKHGNYVNPPDDTYHQERLVVEEDTDGGLTFHELTPPAPWKVEPQKREKLKAGEFTVTYITHACVEINVNGFKIVTDPWLLGPAFVAGWWLLHPPPDDVLARVAAADLIYISHSHSDHMNYPTLRELNRRYGDKLPEIVVGALRSPVWSGDCEHELPAYMTPTELSLGTWRTLGDSGGRLMILPDACMADLDTMVLVEYKGHMVVNTVDCALPNNLNLPEADLLIADFASGAGPFPTCFEMPARKKAAIIAQKRKLALEKTEDVAKRCHARSFIPFAGYFSEFHPLDKAQKALNVKNTPEAACAHMEAAVPGLKGWVPKPFAVFDISTLAPVDSEALRAPIKPPTHDFATFDREIAETGARAPVTEENLRLYFTWASQAFKGYDLLLRFVICDGPDFDPTGVEVIVDFKDLSFPQGPITRPELADRHRITMRVRRHIMAYLMSTGECWDALYVGFQARYHVEPDVYHSKFFDHFLLRLPAAKPPAYKGADASTVGRAGAAGSKGVSGLTLALAVAVLAMLVAAYLRAQATAP